MTNEEIKAQIVAGNIGALTLDTSVFGKPDETSLETPLLKRIQQFKASHIRFILTDIVNLEVSSHLQKQALEAKNKLLRAIRIADMTWTGLQTNIEAAVNDAIAHLPPEIITQQRIDNFLELTGGSIVKSESNVNINELIDRYFSRLPPFGGNEAKKYEFPDAIALLTLESWASKARTKVLVVSNDDDWHKFCATSRSLIAVNYLSQALSLFNSDAVIVCNVIFQRLEAGDYPELVTSIERAIEGHVENMTFHAQASSAYNYDAELYDITILSCSIVNHSEALIPLDMGDEYLVAELSVSVEVEINGDFQFSIRDSIDKDYVSIGSSTAVLVESIELTAVISFSGKIPHDIDIDEVEISGSKSLTVEFGNIEPDWSGYEE